MVGTRPSLSQFPWQITKSPVPGLFVKATLVVVALSALVPAEKPDCAKVNPAQAEFGRNNRIAEREASPTNIRARGITHVFIVGRTLLQGLLL